MVVAGSVCLDLYDLVSDTYMLILVQGEDPAVRDQMGSSVITLFIVFYCTTLMVCAVGIFLKAKIFVALLRRRRKEFNTGVRALDEYTERHTEMLCEVKQGVKMAYAQLSSALLEDLPM